MHRQGHIGMALLAYAPLGAVTLASGFETLAVLGGAATVGLAMLPDVDMRLPGVAHRGPTHTVWFAAAVAAVLGCWGVLAGRDGGVVSAVGLGLFAGLVGGVSVLSHIGADALTPAGVRPLVPYCDREYRYALARASNPLANYGLLGVGVAATFGAVALGRAV